MTGRIQRRALIMQVYRRLSAMALLVSLVFNVNPVSAAPTVNGSVIEMPDDGWYQVQQADNFDSICEGQRRCTVSAGSYIVINHTTGQRFRLTVDLITLSPPEQNPTLVEPVGKVSVVGNTISWPNNGWYQVQNAQTYNSLCEGGQSCEVADGKYIVINHTKNERFKVQVGGTALDIPITNPPVISQTGVTVSANTIQWPDNGWYQVQDATTYQSICEGGRSCTVANGTYIVINHTTNVRYNNIQVAANTTVAPPDTSLPTLQLISPPNLPASCVGSIDQDKVRYCVNPETRVFSATREDESVWWSFALPGETESNQIESVLTTDQWLIIVADRYPTLNTLTPDERSNQYEASLFEKNGAFIRTVPLQLDLSLNGSTDSGRVNDRFSSGLFIDPLRVVAIESDNGNPQLLAGWNRWSAFGNQTAEWDMSGISVFDLVGGVRLRDLYFPGRGIKQLSLVENDEAIVRVVLETSIDWLYIDNLARVPAQYFSKFAADALVAAPDDSQSQLNGRNYQEVIAQVVPWINAEFPNELLYGEFEGVRSVSTAALPLSGLSSEALDDEGRYTNELYQCTNDGTVLSRKHRDVPITQNILDQCRLDGRIYSGKLSSNHVGRDGYAVRGDNLVVRQPDASIATASVGYSTSYSRVISGQRQGYSGSVAGFGLATNGRNVSVANYSSNAQFFYGDNIGTETCAVETDSSGNVKSRLNCKRVRASGSVSGVFSINADWTSYSSLSVSTDLDFGRDYFKQFTWFSNTGSPIPSPIPFAGPTEPLDEFYFSGGTIEIAAGDGSRIELSPTAEPGEQAFNIAVFDKDGNSSGNFPLEFVTIECTERLGNCTVPQ